MPKFKPTEGPCKHQRRHQVPKFCWLPQSLHVTRSAKPTVQVPLAAPSKPPTVALLPVAPFPIVQEVYNAIPTISILCGDLLLQFKARVLGRRAESLAMVEGLARLDKANKLLMSKGRSRERLVTVCRLICDYK